VRPSPTLLAAALVLGGLAACGDGGGGSGSAACGRATREALDPAYLVHVLGDEDLDYTSDPPTSGPHQPTPPVGGVVDEPITRPIQVGILERGDVLLQYQPSLADAERTALEALADDRVTVAPNADLDDPIVATGWLFKQTCSAVDVDELEQFVADHVGNGPEG
jgi:hypothetical protein